MKRYLVRLITQAKLYTYHVVEAESLKDLSTQIKTILNNSNATLVDFETINQL